MSTFYAIHNASEIDVDPEAAGFDVVVTGHSHQPLVERRGAVLYVNPGSAGLRRFSLPIALAMLEISSGVVEAHIVELPAA